MLNLLCIPFLSLLTHPQALRLRLQPELLGYNRELVRVLDQLYYYWYYLQCVHIFVVTTLSP